MALWQESLYQGSLWAGGSWESLQGAEYFFDVVNTQVISGSVRTSGEITVFWGDGTSDVYNGVTDQAYSHDYGAAGNYIVTIFGKDNLTRFQMLEAGANIRCAFTDLPQNITVLNIYSESSLYGDLSELPDNLSFCQLFGGVHAVTGDIADLPAGITTLNLYGESDVEITGDVANLNDNMISFGVSGTDTTGGKNTVYGDVSDLPRSLTMMWVHGHNTISGSLNDLPIGLTFFSCTGDNTISDYTAKTWTTKPSNFEFTPAAGAGLSESEINQLLIDLDDDFSWTTGDITLTGGNAAPTGLGITAKDNMVSEGATVTVSSGEYLFDVVNTQVISGVFQTSAPITVFWGDGDYDSYDGTTDQAWSHDYGSAGDYEVTVNGKDNITKFLMEQSGADIALDLSDLPSGVTYFNCQGCNTVSGSLSDLPSGITYFRCQGFNTVSGPLSGLPSGVTYFNCYGNNTVSGLLSDLPSGVTQFYCYGDNTVSGLLSGLPSVVTNFRCQGFNTVSGLLSDLPSGVTDFDCSGNNTISGYTTKTWTTKPAAFVCVPTGVGGLDESEINQLLIDLDDDFSWTTGKITLTGTNAAPTGAGITAKNNMLSEGATVTTN